MSHVAILLLALISGEQADANVPLTVTQQEALGFVSLSLAFNATPAIN